MLNEFASPKPNSCIPSGGLAYHSTLTHTAESANLIPIKHGLFEFFGKALGKLFYHYVPLYL